MWFSANQQNAQVVKEVIFIGTTVDQMEKTIGSATTVVT
jgi:hypothetical protein